MEALWAVSASALVPELSADFLLVPKDHSRLPTDLLRPWAQVEMVALASA